MTGTEYYRLRMVTNQAKVDGLKQLLKQETDNEAIDFINGEMVYCNDEVEYYKAQYKDSVAYEHSVQKLKEETENVNKEGVKG